MPSPFSPARARAIAAELETWFAQAGKDYPWRRTRDPYAILVSEVMLQQTQVATVLGRGYYERWMLRFPNFATLAHAEEDAVLKAWEGLGYYRRARNLQKLAQEVVARHGGVMPVSLTEVLALPGIGRYTAGALLSFAHDQPVPLVDGNVARVLARLQNDATPVDSTAGQKQLWEQATLLVEAAASPRVLNSSLMELGQQLCRTGSPLCLMCPLRSLCTAKEPESLPVKEKKVQLTDVEEHIVLALWEGQVLLEQETGKRRTGLWKLPAATKAEQAQPPIHQMNYGITRYRVSLSVHARQVLGPVLGENQAWVAQGTLAEIAMPSPYRKALEAAMGRTTA
jgi:A/G-specific adenine glycosylase